MKQVSEATRHLLRRLYDLMTRNSSFFHLDREAEIVKDLQQIAEQGEPGAIGGVVNCLFSPSPDVRAAACRTTQQLLDRLPPEQLQHLAGLITQSCEPFYWEAWDRLTPSKVHALCNEWMSRTSILGLLSFHRNGYVRHETIRHLAQIHDGRELPYLLIRQNDWVEPIREQARRAVQDRLVDDYAPAFAVNLSLVVHLLDVRRQDHSDLVRQVIGLLVQPDHDELLERAIHSQDRAVRRTVVRLALEAEGENRSRVVSHALSSTDGVIRLWASKSMNLCVSGKELEGLLESLSRDGFMPVRREALILQAGDSPDAARRVWRQALQDGNASIRELARFHLGKLGEVDWPGVYRRRLVEEPQSLAALCGLGETGDRSDLARLRELLGSPLASRRRAAVGAFARLGGKDVVAELLRYLRDESPAVSGEVFKQVRESRTALDGEILLHVAIADDRPRVRQYALRLISASGKWPGLPWLIRASVHRDHSTAQLARALVEAWFVPPGCNRVFTCPSQFERQAILEARDESRDQMDHEFLRKLDMWLKAS